MSLESLAQEFADLKRRVDLAETKLAQQAGQFEFITGQLRDVQLSMHARFTDMDAQFNKVNARIDRLDGKVDRLESKMDLKFANVDTPLNSMDAKIDALPRVLAEMLAKR